MMIIENNAKELAAMQEFHNGNRQEGLRLQEEFAAQFRAEYADKDHCPCRKACRYHGNCKECVAIHRAHQEHVPNCMRPMLNKKIKALSGRPSTRLPMRSNRQRRSCAKNFR